MGRFCSELYFAVEDTGHWNDANVKRSERVVLTPSVGEKGRTPSASLRALDTTSG